MPEINSLFGHSITGEKYLENVFLDLRYIILHDHEVRQNELLHKIIILQTVKLFIYREKQ